MSCSRLSCKVQLLGVVYVFAIMCGVFLCEYHLGRVVRVAIYLFARVGDGSRRVRTTFEVRNTLQMLSFW